MKCWLVALLALSLVLTACTQSPEDKVTAALQTVGGTPPFSTPPPGSSAVGTRVTRCAGDQYSGEVPTVTAEFTQPSTDPRGWYEKQFSDDGWVSGGASSYTKSIDGVPVFASLDLEGHHAVGSGAGKVTVRARYDGRREDACAN